MDHEAALQAANQALGSGRRSENRISSVELESVSGDRLSADRSSRPVLPGAGAPPSVMSEGWQIATMLAVAAATLAVVVALWLI